MSWLSTIGGIFMIGHSLFSPTNPQMLREVLAERAPSVRVDAQIINGAPLGYQWENGASAQGLNARRALPGGDYDVVILTEALPLDNHVEFSDSAGNVRRYFELATTANPRSRVFLQETWHDLRSGTGVDIPWDRQKHVPWRERLKSDLPVWQGIVDAANAGRAPDVPAMQLLPAGQAMARLADEIADGNVPGLARIDQVFADEIHPNHIGFYFLTMVQYAAITGESPEGLPRRLKDEWGQPYRAPSPALALALQRIAWAAISEFVPPPPAAPGDPLPASEPAQPPEPQPQPPEDVATPVAGEPPDLPQGFAPPPEPDGPVALGIGLVGINDWSVQQPFLDVMKTARPWIGHLPRQWGGVEHTELSEAGYLDDDGWPLAIPPELGSIGTLILTDLPAEAVSAAGRYRLRFDGEGIVEVGGSATNVRYGRGQVEFDYAPGTAAVDIRIQRTNQRGNHVRNISVVRLDQIDAHDRGQIFNPLWLRHLDGFEVLRFMDWMATNGSTQGNWDRRPRPGDYTYALSGVPVEVMLALLAQTGADGWFNMPHLADDEYIRRFAETVRDGLPDGQKAYVELSNEVWNWQFEQARWADRMAQQRWGKKDSWVAYYGARAAEMAQIWRDVFGKAAQGRIVLTLSTQTGWLGLEDMILNAPDWVAEDATRNPPASYFDAYAVTGYFGGQLGSQEFAPLIRQWLVDSLALAREQADENGLTGADHDAFVNRHRYDLATAQAYLELRDGVLSGQSDGTLAQLLTVFLPYQADIARRHDLDLIMYEGGSHVVGHGPMVDDAELTAFLIHLSYAPEMGELYRDLINGWFAAGGTLFTAYADVYPPNKWGSWGHLRHLGDDNPRWQTLGDYR